MSFLKKLFDQANPLDGGKSFQNQNPQRAPARTPPPSNNRGSNNAPRPRQGVLDRARDVFDPNTEADKFRRVSQGMPRDYTAQQLQKDAEALKDPKNRSLVDQLLNNLQGGAIETVAKVPGSLIDLKASFDNTVPGRVLDIANPMNYGQNIVEFGKDALTGKPLGTTNEVNNAELQRVGRGANDLVESKVQQSRYGQRETDNKYAAGASRAIGGVGAQVATTIATGGGTVLPSALMGARTFSDAQKRAKEAGLSDDKAFGVGAVQGSVEAALEKVGLDALKFPGGGNLLTKTASRFLTEGTQEGTQQAASNLITNKTYDPSQGLTEGVAESALFGGIAGGVAGTGFDFAGGRGKPTTNLVKDQTPQPTSRLVGQSQAAQPTVADLSTGIRPDNDAQTQFEQAYNAGDFKSALKATEGIQDPSLKGFLQQEIADAKKSSRNRLGLKKLNEDGFVAGPLALDFKKQQKQGRVFDGVDGKPRFEVSDKGAKVKDADLSSGGFLGDVLEHPKLYKQYPGMKDVPIEIDSKLPKGSAALDDRTGTLKISDSFAQESQTVKADVSKISRQQVNTKLKELGYSQKQIDADTKGVPLQEVIKLAFSRREINSLAGLENPGFIKTLTPESKGKLLHEIQHEIQGYEGFSRGGSPKNSTGKAMQDYRNLAGEAEARAVSARKDMTDGARQTKPFYDSLDVKKEDLNIRDGKGMAMSKANPKNKVFADGTIELSKAKAKDSTQATPQAPTVEQSPVDSLPNSSMLEANTPKPSPKAQQVARQLEDAGLKPKPRLQDSLDSKSTKIRANDQETSQRTPRSQRTPVEKVNIQDKTSLPKDTTKKTQVKLNTDRLNMDGGYDAMAKLDKETASTVQKLTNEEVESIAKGAGLDTKTYSIGETKTKIAEQLNVRQDAVRLMNEAEVARKAGDVTKAESLLKEAAAQGRVSRTQGTDLARQLQARRIIANELDTPQQRIFKLFDEAGVNPDVYTKRLADVDFGDSKAVVSAYRELVPARASQWLDTVRYNSMLSSPLTQMVNIFGNAQGVLGVAPVEKTLRGTIDAIGGAFGKERKYAAGEGLAYSKGSITNIRNATINFKDALTGGGKYSNPDFDDYNIPLATKGIKGATYKTLSFPMRVLDGMDKFFRTMANGGEEAALDSRTKKGIKLGGNKSALIEEESAYRVFQADSHKPGQGIALDAMDSFADIVMSGRNSKNPVISTVSKFTVPFVRTINNINKQGVIEYSPLGIINMKGNTDKVTALTRATMGTAVFGLSAMLVGAGDMTWAEPRDAEERNRFRAEGKQPYSVKIGGKWVGFSKLHPSISFPMAMVSALDDAFNKGDIDQSFIDKTIEAVSKYGNFMSDQSYAKSVGDTLGAIGGNKEDIARMVSNNIQQVVPFRAFTGWVARMTDSTERKVDTTQNYFDQQVQSLMQQYPGLRQKAPTRDYRGEPIPANNPGLNAFSPVRVTNDRGVNPVDAQLDSIKEATQADPLLDKKQTKEIDGQVAKILSTAQADLIQSSNFQKLSDADKKSKLSKLSTDIRAVERRKYMADNQVGEYAQDFSGKASKLTKDQKSLIQSGNIDTSRYASDAGEIPKGMNNYDVQTLERFAALDDTEKDDVIRTEKDAEYKLTLAQYERDKKLGKISKVEDLKKSNELAKAKVGKDYDKEIREFYSLNKGDIYDYVTNEDDGKEVADKLLAYDDAQVKAGVIEKNKFRDKNGNVKFDTDRKGGKKGKGKSVAGGSHDIAKFMSMDAAQRKQLRALVNSAKVTGGKSGRASGSKVAMRKPNVARLNVKKGK